MKKLGRNFWRVILIVISLPLIFKFYEIFTAPTTGLLVVAGADEWTLAIATAIPWAIPAITFLVIVYDMSRPDDDDTNQGMKFPTFK